MSRDWMEAIFRTLRSMTMTWGSTAPPLREGPTTTEVYEALRPECSGCHEVGSSAPIFASVTDFENLVGLNRDLVDPENPENSVFYRLLVGNSSGLLSQMPPSGPPYSAIAEAHPDKMGMEDIALWIANQPLDASGHQGLDCSDYTIGPAPMRRLTNEEYRFAVEDLFGVDFDPTVNFPPDTEAYGFDNNAEFSLVSRSRAEQYFEAAEAVSAFVFSRGSTMRDRLGIDCNINEHECVGETVFELASLIFRRPITPEEHTDLMVLFDLAFSETEDALSALEDVFQALLLSSHFLYRPEMDHQGEAVGQELRVTGYEMASRLSFFLWSSVPDRALLESAANGELDDAHAIDEIASQMLEDPRAHRAIQRFYPQWLRLSDHDDDQKDLSVYPDWNEELSAAAKQETLRLLTHLTFESNGSIEALLTTDKTVVNHALGSFYGLDVPDDGQWHLKTLNEGRRPGILTRVAFLSHHAKANQSSPILRGVTVREQVLCQPLAPPPQDVDDTPPPLDPNATTRERFAQHTNNDNCASCHTLIDPIGFGFENFDGIGQHRFEENGLPVDTTMDLIGTPALNGVYHDAAEFSVEAGSDEHVQRCVAQQWNRFALGRSPFPSDQCGVDEILADVQGSGSTLRALFMAIISSHAFQHRVVPE